MPLPKMKPGDVFDWLTVVELIPTSGKTQPRVKGICKYCQKEWTGYRSIIYQGINKSCGCIQFKPKHGHAKDGQWSPEYRSWVCMKNRYLDVKHKQYYAYGGRGITVCDRWVNSFKNFLEDMGLKKPGEELDRIDNDVGYSRENCQWLSKQDNLNKRDMTRRYKT